MHKLCNVLVMKKNIYYIIIIYIYIYILQLWLFDRVIVCSTVDQPLKLGAENDLCTGQRRGQEVSIYSATVRVCVCMCGHWIVCGDEESLPRSEWHGGSFLWAWACVHYSDASKDLSGCRVLTSVCQSTYQASSFLVEMTSKHPYTLTASISLYHLPFVHQHVFLSIVLHVLNRRPEAISAPPSCAGFYHRAASLLH